MNSLEIIKQAFYKQVGYKADVDTFLQKVAAWTQKEENKILQVRDTVFFLTLVDPETCQVSILNADTEDNLIENVQGAVNALKNEGLQKMVSYSNEPRYVEIAKKTGFPFKVSQGQGMSPNGMTPAYIFELDLQNDNS
jgi:hypothetical protein